MSKRLVDIDDALLDRAARVLGAATMKETVNRSLASVIDGDRRRRHIRRLREMTSLDLDDPDVMSGAWR